MEKQGEQFSVWVTSSPDPSNVEGGSLLKITEKVKAAVVECKPMALDSVEPALPTSWWWLVFPSLK
jgi:hypothetical protein